MKTTIHRTGKPNSGKRRAHLERLIYESNERKVLYARLTIEEKLEKLDVGGFRALKQRAKLNGQ